MQIPKKLENHRLVETIVEVRFSPAPDVSENLWAGLMMPGMKNAGYEYVPLQRTTLSELPTGAPAIEAAPSGDELEAAMYFNQALMLKVVLQQDTVSFNYLSGYYGGWESYVAEVNRVLCILMECGIVAGIGRVMMRYISEYTDVDMLEQISAQVQLPSEANFRSQELKLMRVEGEARAYIAVTSLLPRCTPDGKIEKMSSLFDVAVFRRLPEGHMSVEDALLALEEVHELELESFFGLLRPEFLETLNPEY